MADGLGYYMSLVQVLSFWDCCGVYGMGNCVMSEPRRWRTCGGAVNSNSISSDACGRSHLYLRSELSCSDKEMDIIIIHEE